MSTPWNNQLVSLVIVSAPSGAYAGIFVYSPAPGHGNLIGSWAASAGTDPYGNAYPQGLNVTLGTISGVSITGGTITGTTITGGTITGTTFNGTNFVLNSSGFFFYSGTPALGNLATSIAPTAGTDSFGNVYPAGIGIEQNGLNLINQVSSTPAAQSNASVLYSSGLGRLRYINSGGADMILERANLNVGNFTMNTQTLPTVMSGALNYLAGEAVLGSEYEIEIVGTWKGPTGAASSVFTFDMLLDGTAFSQGDTSLNVGTVIVQQAAIVYAFRVTFRMLITTLGSSGQAIVWSDGSADEKGVNSGNTSTYVSLNNVSVNNNIDTTIAHTLAIYCHWSSTTGTGHSAITYRTKIARRN